MAPVQAPPSYGDEDPTRHVGPALGVVATVLACTALGAAVDRWRARSAPKGQRQDELLPGWVAGMLASSYGMLIPGLASHLLESRTDFIILGMPQNLSQYDETMVSLIGSLWRDGMHAGAVLVAVYAIVVPGAKLALLALAHRWQHGSAARVTWARRCVRIVQVISKWACPDMFAYILLMCLMRGLNKPPNLRSGMSLNIGFTCFCVFCVASSVSSLGIRMPQLPAPEVAGEKPPQPAARYRLGRRQAAAAVLVLSTCFVVLLAIGLARPSMSLYLDMDLLYEARPDLQMLAPFIKHLGIKLDVLLRNKVSVWQCMVSLCGWIGEGEINSFIALVLYAVFALILPVADMALIVFASVADLRSGSAPSSRAASRALALSAKVRKLEMLDVSIMGSFVVVLTLASMREKGVIVEACSGAMTLLAAEFCHYAAAWVAEGSHRHGPGDGDAPPGTEQGKAEVRHMELDCEKGSTSAPSPMKDVSAAV